MSTGTYIEIIPNEQLVQLESNVEFIEALEELVHSPSLYGFYHLKNGDDDDQEEYFEITEDLDISIVDELETILRQAEQSLSNAEIDTTKSGFESTYDLHKQALPEALTHQNITGSTSTKVVENLLRAEKWPASNNIRILSHQKCIELDNILRDIDVDSFQPFYHWNNHEPIGEWKQQVFDEMTTLLKMIRYAANHKASLLYIYG